MKTKTQKILIFSFFLFSLLISNCAVKMKALEGDQLNNVSEKINCYKTIMTKYESTHEYDEEKETEVTDFVKIFIEHYFSEKGINITEWDENKKNDQEILRCIFSMRGKYGGLFNIKLINFKDDIIYTSEGKSYWAPLIVRIPLTVLSLPTIIGWPYALYGFDEKASINNAFNGLKYYSYKYSVTSSNNLSINKNIIKEVINSDIDIDIPTISRYDSNKYALIIGNEDYSTFQTDLNTEVNVTYAERDAKLFKEYAIKTLGIPHDNILFMINAKSIEMNRQINKMKTIIKNLNGDVEILFYYAGHGLPDIQTKESYLIPVDVSGSDLKYAIKLSEVYENFTEYPSKKVTVFLDACFSGGGRNIGLLSSRGIKLIPKEITFKGNMVSFSATSRNQAALPYKEKGHGMFTYFLLKKIQESKGDVSYSELADYISKQVGIKSTLVNGIEQNPQIIPSSILGEKWKMWRLR